jgi:hypothetical protein
MIFTRKTIHALFNCGCPNAPQAAILGLVHPLPAGRIGWPIFAHLHRNGLCSSNCTRLEDVASPDHAACIAHLRSLNPRHLANILAKHTK